MHQRLGHVESQRVADLDLLGPQNLFWVQVSDLAGVPRELATDADRIFPGDGDLPLENFLEKLHERGYDGYVSLELMNPTIWRANPRQVAEIGAHADSRSVGGRGMPDRQAGADRRSIGHGVGRAAGHNFVT